MDEKFVCLDKAVRKAPKDWTWRREYMTLWMRDQENLEKGREEGIEKGREEIIYELIAAYHEMGMTDDEISEKMQKKFHITEEKARKYLRMAAVVC